MILTDEEVVRWRYLIAANRVEPPPDDPKHRVDRSNEGENEGEKNSRRFSRLRHRSDQ